MRVVHFLKYGFYIPKTLYVNWRLGCSFFWEAPFLPLIITARIGFYCDSSAKIESGPGCYIRLGYGSGGVGVFAHTGIHLELHADSILKIAGVSIFGYGSSICVYPNAELSFGNNTYLAGNAVIKCSKSVNIGNDCAISWNVTIMDSDFHSWSIEGEKREISQAVYIEDNVWIGNNVIILKGVTIGRGSIIGAGSVVTKSVPPNTLVAGNPARILRQGVSWK